MLFPPPPFAGVVGGSFGQLMFHHLLLVSPRVCVCMLVTLYLFLAGWRHDTELVSALYLMTSGEEIERNTFLLLL